MIQNFPSLKVCRKINLYDDKGILVSEDADLYLTIEKRVLFFTKNNDEFKSNNLLRIFNFIRKLGEGGFGSVYLVEQKMNNNKYAIKFLRHSLRSVKNVEFLHQEIEILMRLKHSNIIQLYSFFETKESKIALIMEYLSGGTLKQYINSKENNRLEEEETRKILIQILRTVCYCHKMNIIHHDLKTDNILFTDETYSKIKIIDFGISSLLNVNNKAGSLLYLAPEVINKKDTRSLPSVDIWSIGCIFGEMLTGEKFLEQKAEKSLKN